MICDELDLFIIKSIYENSLEKKEISTWDLSKLYHWGDEYKKMQIGHIHYYNSKCPKIIYRLEKMNRAGLLNIQRNKNETKYEIDGKKVILCQAKKIKDILNKNSEVIMIKSLNEWIIYEI